MAISKRLRYEILKRDNHTCRYCGGQAPDVKLHIDHVIPKSLGGTDDPTNLVTACVSCNLGKSSTSPGDPLVADVTGRSNAWEGAVREAADQLAERSALLDLVCEQVSARWRWWLPNGWESSIAAILKAGLAPAVILEMITATEAARGVDNRWKYFCGCCWRTLQKLQDQAAEAIHAQTDAKTDAQAHAPSNAPSNAQPHAQVIITAEQIESLWSAANQRSQAQYGTDLHTCGCADECTYPDPLLCKLSHATYMLGWIDAESIHKSTGNGPEMGAEVDRGAALDPA